MNIHGQDRHSSPLACSAFCHPEPIRFAQGKLREGSGSLDATIFAMILGLHNLGISGPLFLESYTAVYLITYHLTTTLM